MIYFIEENKDTNLQIIYLKVLQGEDDVSVLVQKVLRFM